MTELTQDVKKEIEKAATNALALQVTTADAYLKAGDQLILYKALEKKIKEYFNGSDGKSGMKPKAYEAWKSICSKEKEEINKLQPALTHLNEQMTTWNLEQEKIRRAEEDRLRREAEKKAEEERLQAAIEAEEAGSQEEAEEILNEPVFVPPPVVEKVVPKVAGQTMTTIWKWRLKDINKVPRQYMKIDEVAINAVVRALKGNTKIDGIEPYPESSMRGTRS